MKAAHSGSALDAPILEFDPEPTAVIEPGDVVEPISIAPHAVLCFFQDVIAGVVERPGGRIVDHVVSEIGRNPIYEIDHGGRRLVVMHPGVGAPLAAGFLEELIARGCRTFVACGAPACSSRRGRGARDRADRGGPRRGHLVPLPARVAHGRAVLARGRRDRRHRRAPWGAPREGLDLDDRRLLPGDPRQGGRPGAGGVPHGRDGGGGFFAVAAFRGVTFGQVLYAGDDLSGDGWDQRGWDEHTTGRETVFRIAAEAVLTLAPDSRADAPRELSVRALRYPPPHGDRGDDRRPHVPVGAADRGVRAQRRRWGCTGSSGTTAPTTTSGCTCGTTRSVRSCRRSPSWSSSPLLRSCSS